MVRACTKNVEDIFFGQNFFCEKDLGQRIFFYVQTGCTKKRSEELLYDTCNVREFLE